MIIYQKSSILHVQDIFLDFQVDIFEDMLETVCAQSKQESLL